MTPLLDTPFLKADCDFENGIFFIIWKPNPEITDDIFKEELAIAAGIYKEKCQGFRLILSDSSQLQLKKKPATEIWSSELAAKLLLGNKAKKIALVMPKQLFTAMSVTRSAAVLHEIGGHVFQIQSFSLGEDAEKWLLESDNK